METSWAKHLDKIVDMIADGVTIVDGKCRFEFVNESAARMLGGPRSEILGRSCHDPRWRITTPDGAPFPQDRLACAVAISTAEPVSGIEYRIERPDRTSIVLSASAHPIFDEDGSVAGAITCFTDITRRGKAR